MFAVLDEDSSLSKRLVFELPFAALAIRKNRHEAVINALCRRTLSLAVTIPDQGSVADLVNDHHGWNILSHIRLPATSLINQDSGVLSALRMLDISLIATAVRSDAEVAELLALDGNYRSEERRVGKECVSTCRSGWQP